MEGYSKNTTDLITSLNSKENIETITNNTLYPYDLTDAEKEFLKKWQPQNALIIYGTLAPGKPNNFIMDPVPGIWQKATVSGKLENKGWGAELGYFGFVHCNDEDAEEIDSYILISDELYKHWQYLDDFEGEGYKRILAEYRLENGENGIGFIYALRT